MLSPNARRSVVAFAEGDNSGGPYGTYLVKKGQLKQIYPQGTGYFNAEIGVDRKARIYAIPTNGGTFIADKNLNLTGIVIGQKDGPQPLAAAFHPSKDRAYFPWSTTTQVKVFDTNTWTELDSYDFEDTFAPAGAYGYLQGRTKLSKDGSLLFVTVTNGVRYVDLTKRHHH